MYLSVSVLPWQPWHSSEWMKRNETNTESYTVMELCYKEKVVQDSTQLLCKLKQFTYLVFFYVVCNDCFANLIYVNVYQKASLWYIVKLGYLF